MQITQLQRHLSVVHHAAARHGHLSACLYGKVDKLLHAVQVRGERGDDDALFARAAEQGLHAGAHLLFGGREARTLGVGGIRQQGQNAVLAVFSNGDKIRRAAGNRRVVDFKIARLDDGSRRACDGQGHRVGDGVVHVDGLHGETAQLELLVRSDLHHFRAAHQPVFFQLVGDEPDGKARGINGQIDLFEQVGQAADVVFMAVRDNNALDAVLILDNIGEIRNDKVHPEHVAVREHDAAVHEDHIALTLVQSDVLANLAQTAQRHDLDRDSRGAGACSGGPAAARVVRPARGLRRSRRDRARLGSCRLRRRSRSVLARVGYAGGCRLGRSGRARPGCFLIIFHSFLHFPRAAKKPCRCSRAGRFSPRICGNSFLFSFFISGIPRKYLKIKRPGRTMGCPMHKTARRTAL